MVDILHPRKNDFLNIPEKQDGNKYLFSDLNHDQKSITYLVMDTLLKWITAPENENSTSYNFEPLRMTVHGKAGAGKSYLIHTITSMIRHVTGVNDSVIVCAPTGKSNIDMCGLLLYE